MTPCSASETFTLKNNFQFVSTGLLKLTSAESFAVKNARFRNILEETYEKNRQLGSCQVKQHLYRHPPSFVVAGNECAY